MMIPGRGVEDKGRVEEEEEQCVGSRRVNATHLGREEHAADDREESDDGGEEEGTV